MVCNFAKINRPIYGHLDILKKCFSNVIFLAYNETFIIGVSVPVP